jgi:hypothetical protein
MMSGFRVVSADSEQIPTHISGVQDHESAAQSFLQAHIEETEGEELSGTIHVWSVGPNYSDQNDRKTFDWSAQIEPYEGDDAEDDEDEFECILELVERK